MKRLSRSAHLQEWSAHTLLVITAIIFGYHTFVRTPENYTEPDREGILSDMQGYITTEQDATLLLALSPGCPYSRRSYPFYKELVSIRNQGQHDVKLIASVDTSVSVRLQTRLLAEAGISVDSIVALPFRALKIHSVPTVALLDNQAIVQNTWQGLP